MTAASSYTREQLLASARGELFGPGKGRLPADPLLLFDRITEINAHGGARGKGKNVVDKRQDIAKRDADREAARDIARARRGD